MFHYKNLRTQIDNNKAENPPVPPHKTSSEIASAFFCDCLHDSLERAKRQRTGSSMTTP